MAQLRVTFFFVFGMLLVVAGLVYGTPAPASKPHLVFILQDDLGHYDVAFNGTFSKAPVPKIMLHEQLVYAFFIIRWDVLR